MEWVLWGLGLYGSFWLLLVAFARSLLLRFRTGGNSSRRGDAEQSGICRMGDSFLFFLELAQRPIVPDHLPGYGILR